MGKDLTMTLSNSAFVTGVYVLERQIRIIVIMLHWCWLSIFKTTLLIKLLACRRPLVDADVDFPQKIQSILQIGFYTAEVMLLSRNGVSPEVTSK